MPRYTVKYFIKKFKAIPENLWVTGMYASYGKHCALGHCGQRSGICTLESVALSELFHNQGLSVVAVNDGSGEFEGSTPKARVINVLESFNV